MDRLQEFTIRLSLVAGAVLGMWMRWWFVVPMAVLTAWSAWQYLRPQRAKR